MMFLTDLQMLSGVMIETERKNMQIYKNHFQDVE